MATEETMRELEQEVGVLVRRVRRVIAERARMVHPDLSSVGYSMLGALQSTGPRRASELVELFAVDKGAVSRHVQVLIEHGLVERSPDPADRRAAILAITEEGSRRLELAQQQRRTQWEAALGDWGEDELRDFTRNLAHYNASLE